MIGGIEANWQAVWTASTGPYKVVWDFGGGAEPNTITINDVTATTSTAAATMVNASDILAATYTFTVTVTNSLGYNLVKTYTYTVGPAPSSPVITSAVYDEDRRSLTVEVDADERALPVTVSLGTSSGITAEEYHATLTEAPLVAEFALDFTGADGISGVSGTANVTATDAAGGSDQESVPVYITFVTLAADTLYAIPLKHEAQVGETVTVVVMTGVPANPFQYMVGVTLSVPDWVDYVASSFNPGVPGGELNDPDGIWGPEGMNIWSFITGPSWGDPEPPLDIPGRKRMEFSLTPLAGHDLTSANGALFNFEVSFTQTGTASFGFLESVPPIDRTYYRDSENNNYLWGQLMANADGSLNLTGYDNTIMVTE